MGKGPGSVYEQSHLNAIRWTHNKNRPYDLWNPATGLGHVQQYGGIKSIHLSLDISIHDSKKTPFVPHIAYQNTVDKTTCKPQNIQMPHTVGHSKKEAQTTNYYMITSGRQRDILNGWKVINKEMTGLWSVVINDKRNTTNNLFAIHVYNTPA